MKNPVNIHYRYSITFLIILFCFIASQKPALSKMYKWVDDDGVTQFSNFPPHNVKKDFQTLSSSSNTKNNISDNIKGIWLYQQHSKNYQLNINFKGVSINEIINGKIQKNIIRASWKLSGKILTLSYNIHKKINKQGTNETFFVVKATGSELILVSDLTNTKIHYSRKGYRKESFIKISPSMQKIVGYWKGATEKNDINFSDAGIFTIKGMTKRYYTTLYQGEWEYNEPELLFHFKMDKVIPGGRLSKTNKTEKYFVTILTDDSLQIRSNKTGKIKKYLRTKKNITNKND